jgi:hypothetical protein
MANDTRNLFISHVHEDDGALQRFKDFLGRNDEGIRDASIDSSKPNDANHPDYIKYEILKPRIQWAGCVVVLISEKTYASEWVDWEIEMAQKLGKRIVGVYDLGSAQSTPPLPPAFELYGDALVGWQIDQVMGAIDGQINNFAATDGTPQSPIFEIERVVCQ